VSVVSESVGSVSVVSVSELFNFKNTSNIRI
jgi:hypothetical protein